MVLPKCSRRTEQGCWGRRWHPIRPNWEIRKIGKWHFCPWLPSALGCGCRLSASDRDRWAHGRDWWKDIQQFRLRRAEQIIQQLKRILVLLPQGAQNARKHSLGPRPLYGPIATPVLTNHHQQTHHAFRHIVGSVYHAWTVKKREQIGPLGAKDVWPVGFSAVA
jgi:hypothetical protein